MKVRATKVVDIKDGAGNTQSYTLNQLKATAGNKFLKKLQRILLPVWAEISSKGEIDQEVIMLVSDKITELDEKDIQDLVCESISMRPDTFDIEFAGNYVGLFELVKEIVMFNYADVFSHLGLGES